MAKSHLPLNALRAFEASARHLSFTKAGMELRVGQAAISHQVKGLEARLGVQLFRRLPRGLALTDEGQALIPAIAGSAQAADQTRWTTALMRREARRRAVVRRPLAQPHGRAMVWPSLFPRSRWP